MPALPKLTGRTAEKRRRKILREFDSEEFRCPDGYIRVSGEISIDLKGEQNGRRREPTASISVDIPKYGIHLVSTGIGDNYFFEISPQNLPKSIYGLLVFKLPRTSELR